MKEKGGDDPSARTEAEFFAPDVNAELGIKGAVRPRPPRFMIKVIPPKQPRRWEPPAQELPQSRQPLRGARVDALLDEVAFESKHRGQFHPGLAYVSAVRPVEVPAAKPVDVLSALRGPGAPIAGLARAGLQGGPTAEEALAMLRLTVGTAQEVGALRYLLRAHERSALTGALREEVANRVAARGDVRLAFSLLHEDASPPEPPHPERALDVDAVLDERSAGKAAAEAEHVLAEDLDAPGVRERHARLSAIDRAGKLTLEAFRAEGGMDKRDELRAAAYRLERSAEPGRAAETYALAGAQEEALRLGLPPRQPVPAEGVLARMAALDRRGARVEALAEARARLRNGADLEVALVARGLEARILRGPVVDLVVSGEAMRAALGDEVTIGRTGATLALTSPAVSRRHLRVRRASGGAVVEDLGSHNGTWIAGARLAGPIPVGEGVTVLIAREIPVAIHPAGEGALAIEVAGERTLASLGPLRLGRLVITARTIDAEPVVELDAQGVEAWLGDERIHGPIQLSRGDVVRTAPPDAVELRVPA